jgi:hypothetical protein
MLQSDSKMGLKNDYYYFLKQHQKRDVHTRFNSKRHYKECCKKLFLFFQCCLKRIKIAEERKMRSDKQKRDKQGKRK